MITYALLVVGAQQGLRSPLSVLQGRIKQMKDSPPVILAQKAFTVQPEPRISQLKSAQQGITALQEPLQALSILVLQGPTTLLKERQIATFVFLVTLENTVLELDYQM